MKYKKSMLAIAMFTVAGLAFGADVKVSLSGANEVPPVTTSATGDGTITVADDGAVSGSVTTKGVQGTAAHIHMAAAGNKTGRMLRIRGQLPDGRQPSLEPVAKRVQVLLFLGGQGHG